MKINHLKTNRNTNPLGFALGKPSLSWIVAETPDKKQTAAQVLIAREPSFKTVLFDSGRVAGNMIDSLAYRPDLLLVPRTRYYWKVRVWGETEQAESDATWFETAKMDEPWQAKWITPDFINQNSHPVLFQSFELPEKIVAARVYICGLGLYHLDLNGRKVGKEYLTPYCNAYDQWLQYQTFEITDYLLEGENQVSVMLGNGWYKGRYCGDGGGSSLVAHEGLSIDVFSGLS
jgi:alpha-L-rhamnosidase